MVIYLTRKNIQFYSVDGFKDELIIPATVFNNLEITDKEQFRKILSDYLEKHPGKNRVPLVLANDLVFKKNYSNSDQEAAKKKMEQFFDSVPLPKALQATKRIITTDIHLYVTNKDLLFLVKEEFEKAGIEIDTAIPISVFGDLGKDERLTKEETQEIMQNLDIARKGDFFAEDSEEDVMDIKNISKQKEKMPYENILNPSASTRTSVKGKSLFNPMTIFLFLVLLLLLSGSIFSAFKVGLIKNPFQGSKEEIKQVTPITENKIATSSAINEATKAAELTKEEREEIKIRILNGTGVKGQANKIKTLLVDLGYEDISAANASSSEITEAEIIFSKDVSSNVRAEILAKLEGVFTKLATKDESPETLKYDVVITTGEEKN